MKLNTFFNNSSAKLGYIYALKGNGHYYDRGFDSDCSRAKLQVLRSYMQSLNTEILGVMLFGSAVAMPENITIRKKKWWLFGPVVETTVQRRVKWVNDFDFAIFTKDSQMPTHAPGVVIDGYDFYAQVSSGLHMMCLTPEEYKTGIATSDPVAQALQDKGVMIMSNQNFELADIGNPKLRAYWILDSDGGWNCRIRIQN